MATEGWEAGREAAAAARGHARAGEDLGAGGEEDNVFEECPVCTLEGVACSAAVRQPVWGVAAAAGMEGEAAAHAGAKGGVVSLGGGVTQLSWSVQGQRGSGRSMLLLAEWGLHGLHTSYAAKIELHGTLVSSAAFAAASGSVLPSAAVAAPSASQPAVAVFETDESHPWWGAATVVYAMTVTGALDVIVLPARAHVARNKSILWSLRSTRRGASTFVEDVDMAIFVQLGPVVQEAAGISATAALAAANGMAPPNAAGNAAPGAADVGDAAHHHAPAGLIEHITWLSLERAVLLLGSGKVLGLELGPVDKLSASARPANVTAARNGRAPHELFCDVFALRAANLLQRLWADFLGPTGTEIASVVGVATVRPHTPSLVADGFLTVHVDGTLRVWNFHTRTCTDTIDLLTQIGSRRPGSAGSNGTATAAQGDDAPDTVRFAQIDAMTCTAEGTHDGVPHFVACVVMTLSSADRGRSVVAISLTGACSVRPLAVETGNDIQAMEQEQEQQRRQQQQHQPQQRHGAGHAAGAVPLAEPATAAIAPASGVALQILRQPVDVTGRHHQDGARSAHGRGGRTGERSLHVGYAGLTVRHRQGQPDASSALAWIQWCWTEPRRSDTAAAKLADDDADDSGGATHVLNALTQRTAVIVYAVDPEEASRHEAAAHHAHARAAPGAAGDDASRHAGDQVPRAQNQVLHGQQQRSHEDSIREALEYDVHLTRHLHAALPADEVAATDERFAAAWEETERSYLQRILLPGRFSQSSLLAALGVIFPATTRARLHAFTTDNDVAIAVQVMRAIRLAAQTEFAALAQDRARGYFHEGSELQLAREETLRLLHSICLRFLAECHKHEMQRNHIRGIHSVPLTLDNADSTDDADGGGNSNLHVLIVQRGLGTTAFVGACLLDMATSGTSDVGTPTALANNGQQTQQMDDQTGATVYGLMAQAWNSVSSELERELAVACHHALEHMTAEDAVPRGTGDQEQNADAKEAEYEEEAHATGVDGAASGGARGVGTNQFLHAHVRNFVRRAGAFRGAARAGAKLLRVPGFADAIQHILNSVSPSVPALTELLMEHRVAAIDGAGDAGARPGNGGNDPAQADWATCVTLSSPIALGLMGWMGERVSKVRWVEACSVCVLVAGALSSDRVSAQNHAACGDLLERTVHTTCLSTVVGWLAGRSQEPGEVLKGSGGGALGAEATLLGHGLMVVRGQLVAQTAAVVQASAEQSVMQGLFRFARCEYTARRAVVQHSLANGAGAAPVARAAGSLRNLLGFWGQALGLGPQAPLTAFLWLTSQYRLLLRAVTVMSVGAQQTPRGALAAAADDAMAFATRRRLAWLTTECLVFEARAVAQAHAGSVAGGTGASGAGAGADSGGTGGRASGAVTSALGASTALPAWGQLIVDALHNVRVHAAPVGWARGGGHGDGLGMFEEAPWTRELPEGAIARASDTLNAQLLRESILHAFTSDEVAQDPYARLALSSLALPLAPFLPFRTLVGALATQRMERAGTAAPGEFGDAVRDVVRDMCTDRAGQTHLAALSVLWTRVIALRLVEGTRVLFEYWPREASVLALECVHDINHALEPCIGEDTSLLHAAVMDEVSAAYSSLFRHALDAGDIEQAKAALASQPNKKRRWEGVRMLTVRLCERGHLGELWSPPRNEESGWSGLPDMEKVLAQLASASDARDIVRGVTVNYYNCLYSLHIANRSFQKAAQTAYMFHERVYREVQDGGARLDDMPHISAELWLRAQLSALLQCALAMRLIPTRQPYVVYRHLETRLQADQLSSSSAVQGMPGGPPRLVLARAFSSGRGQTSGARKRALNSADTEGGDNSLRGAGLPGVPEGDGAGDAIPLLDVVTDSDVRIRLLSVLAAYRLTTHHGAAGSNNRVNLDSGHRVGARRPPRRKVWSVEQYRDLVHGLCDIEEFDLAMDLACATEPAASLLVHARQRQRFSETSAALVVRSQMRDFVALQMRTASGTAFPSAAWAAARAYCICSGLASPLPVPQSSTGGKSDGAPQRSLDLSCALAHTVLDWLARLDSGETNYKLHETAVVEALQQTQDSAMRLPTWLVVSMYGRTLTLADFSSGHGSPARCIRQLMRAGRFIEACEVATELLQTWQASGAASESRDLLARDPALPYKEHGRSQETVPYGLLDRLFAACDECAATMQQVERGGGVGLRESGLGDVALLEDARTNLRTALEHHFDTLIATEMQYQNKHIDAY